MAYACGMNQSCKLSADNNRPISAFHTPLSAWWNFVYVLVQVFFSELTHTHVETEAAYTWLALLCDIGGALGLILGSTILTVCEFTDFCILQILVWIRVRASALNVVHQRKQTSVLASLSALISLMQSLINVMYVYDQQPCITCYCITARPETSKGTALDQQIRLKFNKEITTKKLIADVLELLSFCWELCVLFTSSDISAVRGSPYTYRPLSGIAAVQGVNIL